MVKLSNSPYYIPEGEKEKKKMVALSATELALLRGFVRDTWEIIQSDIEGITLELEVGCLQAAEILGIVLSSSRVDDE